MEENIVLQLPVLLSFHYLHRFVVDSFDKGPEEHCGNIGTHVYFKPRKKKDEKKILSGISTGIFVPNDHYEPMPWRGQEITRDLFAERFRPSTEISRTLAALRSYCTFRGEKQHWTSSICYQRLFVTPSGGHPETAIRAKRYRKTRDTRKY